MIVDNVDIHADSFDGGSDGVDNGIQMFAMNRRRENDVDAAIFSPPSDSQSERAQDARARGGFGIPFSRKRKNRVALFGQTYGQLFNVAFNSAPKSRHSFLSDHRDFHGINHHRFLFTDNTDKSVRSVPYICGLTFQIDAQLSALDDGVELGEGT